MSYYYKKYLSFNLWKFIKDVFPVLLVLVVSVIADLLLGRLLVFDSNLINFIIKAALFVIIYCPLIFVIANQYEKDFIYRFLAKMKIGNKR